MTLVNRRYFKVISVALLLLVFIYWGVGVYDHYNVTNLNNLTIPQDVEKYPEPTDPIELLKEDTPVDYAHAKGVGEVQDSGTTHLQKTQVINEGHEVRRENLKLLTKKLASVIGRNKPNVEPVQGFESNQLLSNAIYNAETLKGKTNFDDSYIQSLKESYTDFISDIDSLLKTEDIKYLYRGRGVVLQRDENSLPLTLHNLMLQFRFQTSHSIEIISTDENLPQHISPNILPNKKFQLAQHNLTDYVGQDQLSVLNPHSTKQVKHLLSLLVSPYREKVFVSSDSALLVSPRIFFFAFEPLASTGLILWPSSNTGKRVTHPSFYDAVNKTVSNERMRVGADEFLTRDILEKVTETQGISSFHDLKGAIPEGFTTTDNCIINIDKHIKTIAVALYLSAYEDWFFPLLSQSESEESRETIRSDILKIAAVCLNNPLYDVKTPSTSATNGVLINTDFSTETTVSMWYKKQMEDGIITPQTYNETDFLTYYQNLDIRKFKLNLFLNNATVLLDLSKSATGAGHHRLLQAGQILTMNQRDDFEMLYYEHWHALRCELKSIDLVLGIMETPKVCQLIKQQILYLQNVPPS